MSGYCPDCGNVQCLCDEIEAERNKNRVRHKKTGNIYYIKGYVINTTNGCEYQSMVLYYHPEHNTDFVREENEFWEKFEQIKKEGEK